MYGQYEYEWMTVNVNMNCSRCTWIDSKLFLFLFATCSHCCCCCCCSLKHVTFCLAALERHASLHPLWAPPSVLGSWQHSSSAFVLQVYLWSTLHQHHHLHFHHRHSPLRPCLPLLFISFPLIIIFIIIPPLHHFLAHLLRTLFVIIVLMIITIRYSLSRRHQSLSSMGTARRDRAGPGDRLLHFVVALSLTHTHPHTRCLSFTTSIKFNWVQFNCNVLYFYWGIKIKKDTAHFLSPSLSLSPRLSLPPCHTLSVWQNGADRRRQSVQMPQSLTRTAEELKLKLRNSPGERVTAGEKQWKGSEGQWGSGGWGRATKEASFASWRRLLWLQFNLFTSRTGLPATATATETAAANWKLQTTPAGNAATQTRGVSRVLKNTTDRTRTEGPLSVYHKCTILLLFPLLIYS